ncbi:MAG TPA: HAD hydrolase family protein [Planctomycetota bacterium]|jgi:3-deoxy-D-manno-octulosonate 8-phosphate phosphatase (KDO 8-P phosphatase)|nr:HAD hydrolase family protein [Planctomycetota bacterium]
MTKDLSQIRMLILDVDGILTDGSVWMGTDGTHFKKFSILDGAGIKEWMRCGHELAIISGHESDATRHRFSALGVREVFVGVKDKMACLADLLQRTGMLPNACAAMGDDLMDLPMMLSVHWSATVRSAHPQVLRLADYVTQREGGAGAVREVMEHILTAQGRMGDILKRYHI